jgi:negative regulator of genetic competence, sporulation and motility
MENKQTAFEEYIEQHNKIVELGDTISLAERFTRFADIIDKAKEMEKEQIISALYNGYLYEGPMPDNECFGEQYFNKKYGGKK